MWYSCENLPLLNFRCVSNRAEDGSANTGNRGCSVRKLSGLLQLNFITVLHEFGVPGLGVSSAGSQDLGKSSKIPDVLPSSVWPVDHRNGERIRLA